MLRSINFILRKVLGLNLKPEPAVTIDIIVRPPSSCILGNSGIVLSAKTSLRAHNTLGNIYYIHVNTILQGDSKLLSEFPFIGHGYHDSNLDSPRISCKWNCCVRRRVLANVYHLQVRCRNITLSPLGPLCMKHFKYVDCTKVA